MKSMRLHVMSVYIHTCLLDTHSAEMNFNGGVIKYNSHYV
jgi:hypothetical protein